MLLTKLWTQETCNPLPGWSPSHLPIGSGLIYDPAQPNAPVFKPDEGGLCTVNPEMNVDGSHGPGLWGINEAPASTIV